MSDNREKELWRRVRWYHFLFAGIGAVILIGVYIGISRLVEPSTSLCDILWRFVLDIIVNLFPVSLLFIMSYVFFRRIEELRFEQETEQIASIVASEVRKVFRDELAATRQQGLVIQSADYGAGQKVVDVTQQIWELVSENELKVRADHNILGITDPAPHIKKRLKVVYSYAVHNRTALTDEGETLLLP